MVTEPRLVWPGIYQNKDRIFAKVDIRIHGIQAPEKRIADDLSDQQRAYLKGRAPLAKQALKDLLQKTSVYPGLIIIDDPQYGKHEDGVVAKVKIPTLNERGKYEEIDVAKYLLFKGHAFIYNDD